MPDASCPVAYLYVLRDPRTGEVRYVGRTTNPKLRRRFYSSPARLRNPSPANLWCWVMERRGAAPLFEAVAVVPAAEQVEREAALIRQHAAGGRTFNVQQLVNPEPLRRTVAVWKSPPLDACRELRRRRESPWIEVRLLECGHYGHALVTPRDRWLAGARKRRCPECAGVPPWWLDVHGELPADRLED